MTETGLTSCTSIRYGWCFESGGLEEGEEEERGRPEARRDFCACYLPSGHLCYVGSRRRALCAPELSPTLRCCATCSSSGCSQRASSTESHLLSLLPRACLVLRKAPSATLAIVHFNDDTMIHESLSPWCMLPLTPTTFTRRILGLRPGEKKERRMSKRKN